MCYTPNKNATCISKSYDTLITYSVMKKEENVLFNDTLNTFYLRAWKCD